MREWAQARGRMESEIQRRKEHINEATNFEKARGFVRTNWKTKNWNPNDDPTQVDSSTDSEDVPEEQRDMVGGMQQQTKQMSPSSDRKLNTNSEYSEDANQRDNLDVSGHQLSVNQSLNMTNQLSDSKARKRLYMQKPEIIEITESQ